MKLRTAGNLKLKVNGVSVIHYLLISLSNSNSLPPYSFLLQELPWFLLISQSTFVSISEESFKNLFDGEVMILLPRMRWHLSAPPAPFQEMLSRPLVTAATFREGGHVLVSSLVCTPAFVQAEWVYTAHTSLLFPP